jgi:hypothetical protein
MPNIITKSGKNKQRHLYETRHILFANDQEEQARTEIN